MLKANTGSVPGLKKFCQRSSGIVKIFNIQYSIINAQGKYRQRSGFEEILSTSIRHGQIINIQHSIINAQGKYRQRSGFEEKLSTVIRHGQLNIKIEEILSTVTRHGQLKIMGQSFAVLSLEH